MAIAARDLSAVSGLLCEVPSQEKITYGTDGHRVDIQFPHKVFTSVHRRVKHIYLYVCQMFVKCLSTIFCDLFLMYPLEQVDSWQTGGRPAVGWTARLNEAAASILDEMEGEPSD